MFIYVTIAIYQQVCAIIGYWKWWILYKQE